MIKFPCVLLTIHETKDASVTLEMWEDTGFLFLLGFFFLSSGMKVDKKCANSTQRSPSSNS